MDSKILSIQLISALVSAGVSLLFSIIYFFGKKICSCYKRYKQFKMYKKYVIEFLENYLYFLENKKYKYYEKEYKIDDLNVYYYPDVTPVKISPISSSPFIVLSFFKENKILSNEESRILTDIILKISEYNKIFVLDYIIHNSKIVKDFTRFEIVASTNEILSSGLENEHILTVSLDETSLGNKVRTILKELKESKDDKYDIRIKKIIDNTLNK